MNVIWHYYVSANSDFTMLALPGEFEKFLMNSFAR